MLSNDLYECLYCHTLYPQNRASCPTCSTNKGAKIPPYQQRTQRAILGIVAVVVLIIIGFIIFLFSQYCDPITEECGIDAHISALQATLTPDMTQTFRANAMSTAQAHATSTERVQIALTEFAYNSMIASTNVAATRQAEPTITAQARNVNVTMTFQADTILGLETRNAQMGETATTIAQKRPNHFLADGVNRVAYATYDNLQMSLFIEDGIVIILVFCFGIGILAVIGGVIAFIMEFINNN